MKWNNYYLRHFHLVWFWAEETSGGFLSKNRLKAMLEMIAKTQEDELTCEQVHIYMGQFAELTSQRRDVDLPLVVHHLALCRECREEYEALVRILQAPGGDHLPSE